jgi:hypothetical protein
MCRLKATNVQVARNECLASCRAQVHAKLNHNGSARAMNLRANRTGRIEARTGLRMMTTFPRSSLSFPKRGFPQHGWKAGFPRCLRYYSSALGGPASGPGSVSGPRRVEPRLSASRPA